MSAAQEVRSADGTPIAFERRGSGPPLIIVDGALCYREMGPGAKLAKALAPHFTVFSYDRRGRGASGDAGRYEVEREVQDIQALIAEAGGSAGLFGHSSGAVLALETAKRTPAVEKLALYEAPLIVDDSRAPMPKPYPAALSACIAAGRHGEAVRMFMVQVGLPAPIIALLRLTPMWSKLTAIAHTLVYDDAILTGLQRGQPVPAGRWAQVTAPALVMVGGKSPAWFDHGARGLAHALPDARHLVIAGQRHNVKAKAVASALVEFQAAAPGDVGQARLSSPNRAASPPPGAPARPLPGRPR